MLSLEQIKDYFGEQCKTFPKLTEVETKLSEKTKEILYEIGLPNYKGYAGDYIMLDKLQIIDNKYLQFATRDFDEDFFKECIDLKTGQIVFNLSYDGNKDYHVLNSDLEAYLKYVYIDNKFHKEVKIPEKLGPYHKNHSKYAKELKRQFLEINKDVNSGSWADLIEEMELGVL